MIYNIGNRNLNHGNLKVLFGSKNISQVNSIKYVGLTFESNKTFNLHVNN
jgi:hypothetical protein